MSGDLIAFYQVGYGLAAFGVGPLHQLVGSSFSSMFSGGSIVALAFMLMAARLARLRTYRGSELR